MAMVFPKINMVALVSTLILRIDDSIGAITCMVIAALLLVLEQGLNLGQQLRSLKSMLIQNLDK